MRDIKPLLKEAKEAIKGKNYELALKLSRQILKEERDNYTAMVFMGVSLQETGHVSKAEVAFKDATRLNSSNPLAWNGLVNFYEKTDPECKNRDEIVKAYVALLKIEPNAKKLLEYAHKLNRLGPILEPQEPVLALYDLVQNDKVPERDQIWSIIVSILKGSDNAALPPQLIDIFEEALKSLLGNPKTICTEFYSDYLTFLHKQQRTEQLVAEAKKMHELFQIDSISLRWLCKVFTESYIEGSKVLEPPESMEAYADALLKLEHQSPTALMVKSILLIESEQLLEAKSLLNKVVAVLPKFLNAWILLLKINVRLMLYPDASVAANKVQALLSESGKQASTEDVQVSIVEALSKSDDEADLRHAIELTSQGNLKGPCIPHLIRAHINLASYPQAKLLLTDLIGDDDTKKLLTAQMLHKIGNLSDALNLLNGESQLWDWWIEIGTLYWDLGARQKSLIPFLKAAKLDPTNYRCFLWLGHYYRDAGDLEKSRRCYEKSFRINPKCAEAGMELSTIYRKLNSWDANLALLQSLTGGVINGKNCWAWMELGLHYLEQGDYDRAITNLRYVIRVDEQNMHCWESLADAYLAKGSYTSALKSYTKASELSQHGLYPSLQMATIKQLLGDFTGARVDFQQILLNNTHYVPALKGISETCIQEAKACYRDKRLGTSRDHIQFASEKIITAIEKRPDLACLWKLLGDCCLFVTKLPEQYCFLMLPKAFAEGNVEQVGNKILEKNDLFVLGSRSYCKSLSIDEDNVLLWHDLACCYLSHFCVGHKDEELLDRAMQIARYCTVNNGGNWQHWNLLGNVAVSSGDYRLAQHALIKAVTTDNNSAISWCNLGTLYLILEEYKLANEAFSQAQRSDPNYVNSWIGQALLAELFDHDDAMDLFRHSTQLDVNQQGALGYAHWVCKTLKESRLDVNIYSIHNMHAIPVACDALTWYTENNPNDSAAWNMLGILRERLGLTAGSSKAYKNAMALCESDVRDLARVNFGRSLSQLGDLPKAIDVLSQVEKATFNSGIALALALFKNRLYQESYEAYESALHWLTDNERQQSELLVALASMAYMFEGPEVAKTLLSQSVDLKNPSPWGLYSTLSLALLHNDPKLSQVILQRLNSVEDIKENQNHCALLIAYFHLIQGDHKRAIREVSKMVHKHPEHAGIWLTLSALLVRLQKANKQLAKAASKCAQAAMKLGQSDMDVTKALCLVSVSAYLEGDHNRALLMAQKAVHSYPDLAQSWAVLVSALVATKKSPQGRIQEIAKVVESLRDSSPFVKWTRKIY